VGPPARVSSCPLEPRGIQVGCEVHACECVGAAWGRNTSHRCLPRGVIPVVCVAGHGGAARLSACPMRRAAGGGWVRLGGVPFPARGRVAGPRGAHCVWSATRRARCVSAGRRGGGVGRVSCVGPRCELGPGVVRGGSCRLRVAAPCAGVSAPALCHSVPPGRAQRVRRAPRSAPPDRAGPWLLTSTAGAGGACWRGDPAMAAARWAPRRACPAAR
jgi:hypothetical protein